MELGELELGELELGELELGQLAGRAGGAKAGRAGRELELGELELAGRAGVSKQVGGGLEAGWRQVRGADYFKNILAASRSRQIDILQGGL